MNKKLLRTITLGVLLFAISSSIVDASEHFAQPDATYVEMPHEGDVVESEVFTEKEMSEMCSVSEADIKRAAFAIEPDPYEPNNTMETAYPYSKTERITGALAFNEGYRYSNCHVEGDEDFFSINLTASCVYDVILKNLYRQDRHIYIWESNGDGTWTRWKYKYQQTGQPEYWCFVPSRSGIHYIQIAGGGPDGSYFWFAVERAGTVNTALWPDEL